MRFTVRLAAAVAALAVAVISAGALADTVYVTADRMVDVVAGRMVDDPAVLIEDGRITRVGRQGGLTAPPGARRIDLSGHTLLPGLIDMHVHLTGDHDEGGYRALAIPTVRDAITGVKNAKLTLEAGFTTVRNVGARGFTDVALRDAINDGDVPGPRMLVSGPPIGITGGHCSDGNLLPPDYNFEGEGVADGPWAVRAKVRRNVKYGVDMIKTCSTGGVLSKGTQVGAPQYTLEELTALVDEAHMHGRKVASHAHGAEGIKNALRAGVDTVEHASFIDAEGLRMARENGVVLVMDVYVTEFILGEGEAAGILPESLEKERQTGSVQRRNFGLAVAAGVKLGFGTDAGVYPHGTNALQFSRMTEFGLSPIGALQAATTVAAKALGMEADVGAIAVGRYGDLIAIEGDPLVDISKLENVVVVIKGGEMVKDAR